MKLWLGSWRSWMLYLLKPIIEWMNTKKISQLGLPVVKKKNVCSIKSTHCCPPLLYCKKWNICTLESIFSCNKCGWRAKMGGKNPLIHPSTFCYSSNFGSLAKPKYLFLPSHMHQFFLGEPWSIPGPEAIYNTFKVFWVCLGAFSQLYMFRMHLGWIPDQMLNHLNWLLSTWRNSGSTHILSECLNIWIREK